MTTLAAYLTLTTAAIVTLWRLAYRFAWGL